MLAMLVSFPSMPAVIFSNSPLSYAIQPKTLVPVSYHVVLTTNIHVNRTDW
jgi:hypothetical protein